MQPKKLIFLLFFIGVGIYVTAQNHFVSSPPGFGLLLPMQAFQGSVFCMARDMTSTAQNYSVFRLNTINNGLTLISSDTSLGGVDLRNFMVAGGLIYFTSRSGLHQLDVNTNTIKRVARFTGTAHIYNFNGNVFFTRGDSKSYFYNAATNEVDTLKFNNADVNPGTFPQVIVYGANLYFIGQGTGAQVGFSYIYRYSGSGKSLSRASSPVAEGSLSITTSYNSQAGYFTPLVVNGRTLFYIVNVNLTRSLVSLDLSNLSNLNRVELAVVNNSFDNLTILNNLAYYTNFSKLYRTDGLSVAELAADIQLGGFRELPNNAFVTLNNKLYGVRTDNETGTELWVSDGSTNGTSLLYDVYGGTYNGLNNNQVPNSGNPITPVVYNGILYFLATGPGKLFSASGIPSYSYFVWKTDGTPEGTERYSGVECLSNFVTKGALAESNNYLISIGANEQATDLVLLKPIQYLGGNSVWENSNAWSGNTVPQKNDDVIVNAGNLNLQSNATIVSLKVNSSATISVSTGSKLTITK